MDLMFRAAAANGLAGFDMDAVQADFGDRGGHVYTGNERPSATTTPPCSCCLPPCRLPYGFNLLHCPLLPGPSMLYSALMMSFYRKQFCGLCSNKGHSAPVKRSASDRQLSYPSRHSAELTSDDDSAHKCRRLDGAASSSPPPGIDTMTSVDSSRKCAGTQTSFSSFLYPSGSGSNTQQQQHLLGDPFARDAHASDDEPRLILDLDRHMSRFLTPPQRVGSGGSGADEDPSNVPLNLTVSATRGATAAGYARQNGVDSLTRAQWAAPSPNSSVWKTSDNAPVPAPPPHPAPPPAAAAIAPSSSSVLAWMESCIGVKKDQLVSTRGGCGMGVDARRPEPGPCVLRPEPRKCGSVVTVECEEDIEAHFARSLGRDYSRCLARQPDSPVQSLCTGSNGLRISAEYVEQNDRILQLSAEAVDMTDDSIDRRQVTVSVAGSVDDHFTKSLGPVWNRIKSSIDVQPDGASSAAAISISPVAKVSAVPGSVDDHFAKALGETWYKIKAECEKV